MKLSVSLSSKDAEFLDAYARKTGAPSRSAVFRQALDLLRAQELEQAYTVAWREWARADDPELWERTIGDGIDDAPR